MTNQPDATRSSGDVDSLSAERKGQGWMPIESAPKDGTRVHLLCPIGEDAGHYDSYIHLHPLPVDPITHNQMRGEWSTDNGNGEPTHWKPEAP